MDAERLCSVSPSRRLKNCSASIEHCSLTSLGLPELVPRAQNGGLGIQLLDVAEQDPFVIFRF